MKKAILCDICLLLLVFSMIACAEEQQSNVLVISAQQPVVDGEIKASEYSLIFNFARMDLYMSRDQQNLTFALEGKTTGWVAIGFNEMLMDDALIFLAYVEGGKSQLVQQLGVGHSHQDADLDLLVKHAILEADPKTIFEGKIPINKLLKESQKELKIIIACGEDDNIDSYHAFRQGFTIKLAE